MSKTIGQLWNERVRAIRDQQFQSYKDEIERLRAELEAAQKYISAADEEHGKQVVRADIAEAQLRKLENAERELRELRYEFFALAERMDNAEVRGFGSEEVKTALAMCAKEIRAQLDKK